MKIIRNIRKKMMKTIRNIIRKIIRNIRKFVRNIRKFVSKNSTPEDRFWREILIFPGWNASEGKIPSQRAFLHFQAYGKRRLKARRAPLILTK